MHLRQGYDQVSQSFHQLHGGPPLSGTIINGSHHLTVHLQMQEVPEDFFVDIISQNNFLVASLSDLFANVREHEDMSPQLRQKAISFENHLTKKFGWDFSQEEDEYAPVVVEL